MIENIYERTKEDVSKVSTILRNRTPDSVKYLFYETAQQQAKTASHLRIISGLYVDVFQVNTVLL